MVTESGPLTAGTRARSSEAPVAASFRSALGFASACRECGELLVSRSAPAVRTLHRRRVRPAHYQLFELLPTVMANVFKDRHSLYFSTCRAMRGPASVVKHQS